MNGTWFFHHGGQDYGPVSTEQLSQLLAAGQLTPEHPVRRASDAQWMPAASFAELRSTAAPAAAAAPEAKAKPPVKKPPQRVAPAPPPPPPPAAAPPAAMAPRPVAPMAMPLPPGAIPAGGAVPVGGPVPVRAAVPMAMPLAHGAPVAIARPVAVVPSSAVPLTAAPLAAVRVAAVQAVGAQPTYAQPGYAQPGYAAPQPAATSAASGAAERPKKKNHQLIILTVLAAAMLGVAVVGGVLIATSGGKEEQLSDASSDTSSTIDADEPSSGNVASSDPSSPPTAETSATTPPATPAADPGATASSEPAAPGVSETPAAAPAGNQEIAALLAQIKSFGTPKSTLGISGKSGRLCKLSFHQAFISSSATPVRMTSSAASVPSAVGGRMLFIELRIQNTSPETITYEGWNETAVAIHSDGTKLELVPRDKTPTVTRATKMELDPGREITDTLVYVAPATLPTSIKLILPQSTLIAKATRYFAFEIPQQTLFEEPVPDILRTNDIGDGSMRPSGPPILSQEAIDKQIAEAMKNNPELQSTIKNDQGKEPVKPGTPAAPGMVPPAGEIKPGEMKPDAGQPDTTKPDAAAQPDTAPALMEKPKLQVVPATP